MKKALMGALAALTLLATGASANDDAVIAVRQAIMQSNGFSSDLLLQMMYDAIPFSAADAKATLQVIAANLTNFPNLFPDDSKDNTRALPAVWDNRAAFTALAAKMVKDATAASNEVMSLDAMKASTNLQAAFDDCDACHQMFRNF